jgi:ATP-dependent Clp protease protease subunit
MRNRLLQLLSDNRRGYVPMQQRIVAAADGANEATVYLYDAIVADRITAEWWGGVCPQDFVPAMRALNVATIHLRINSPGGDAFAVEAMCQALRDSTAHVVAHIEGLAASSATVLACAADEVVISANSKYMIHQSWCMAMGNAGDMRAMASLLDKCDATMIAEYVRRTGNDTAKVAEWCDAETWFTGQEAVDAGFADRLSEEAAKPSAQARGAWNLRAYSHAPQDLPEDAVEADPRFDAAAAAHRAAGAAAIVEAEAEFQADLTRRAHLHRQVSMKRVLAPIA